MQNAERTHTLEECELTENRNAARTLRASLVTAVIHSRQACCECESELGKRCEGKKGKKCDGKRSERFHSSCMIAPMASASCISRFLHGMEEEVREEKEKEEGMEKMRYLCCSGT